MATINKLPSGKWQAQVARQGVRKSKSFQTKIEAKDWASREEYLITKGESGGSVRLLKEIFERYELEVSRKKRGWRWEAIRLRKFAESPLGEISLKELKPAHIAAWRDQRLGEISPASVRREMTLISHILTIARREWGLIDKNPCTDVRKPPEPPHRDRLIDQGEIERLLYVTGYSDGGEIETATQRVAVAFLFAIETAMRAGEIRSLTWDSVDMKKRVARLYETKNGQSRDVPLSQRAVELLGKLPQNKATCFDLSSGQFDALFRKTRDKAGIENLHFHDTRHEAITRLAKKLDVLSLARMVGHRDLKMLMVYYNETAEELAKKLV